MLEVAIAPGAEQLEVRGEREQLVARCDVDDFAIERDTAEPAIPAATLPVDSHRVPVEQPRRAPVLEIDDVHAAVTFALAGTANNRRCDENRQWVVRSCTAASG